jgi:hypothetical protein
MPHKEKPKIIDFKGLCEEGIPFFLPTVTVLVVVAQFCCFRIAPSEDASSRFEHQG